MNGGIRIGRVAGVPLSVHPSVLVIVVLLAWSLAAEQLPDLSPGESRGWYWVVGVVGALVFFGALLAHELAHTIAAQRAGVEVTGLSLWLFGGVAFLGGEAPDARSDLRIALAGPLTSIAVGVAFGAVALATSVLGLPDLVVAIAVWLAVVNVALAVFNLIPGAPLDGGRVLRAVLWQRNGDRYGSAITAARVGRGVGIALVVLGVVEVLFSNVVGGLWLGFIGWFVHASAAQEQADAVLRRDLRDVRVCDVMRPVAPFLPARDGEPIARPTEAVMPVHDRLVSAGRERAVVVDGDLAVGIVTDDDILGAGRDGARRRRPAGTSTRRLPPMPPPPPWHGIISGRR